MELIKKTEVLGKCFKVYGTPENPLFLAKDVAEWIEHSDVSTMLRNVDEDEKVTNIVCTLGGNQKSWFLTENGLYEVLMLSRKPFAKLFKKEVKKILHSIRTNGGYIARQESLSDEELLAKSVLVAQKIIEQKDKVIEEQSVQIAEMKPKAEGFTEYIDRGRFCNFRDAANYCRVPQKELMDLLKTKYIYKNSVGEYRCYAEYTELFALRPFVKGEHTRQQLMLTAAGLSYFGRLLSEMHSERSEEIRLSAMEAVRELMKGMPSLCPAKSMCKNGQTA